MKIFFSLLCSELSVLLAQCQAVLFPFVYVSAVFQAKCRFDHFDNPALLTLNIYAKNSDPGACEFEANSCRLRVRIVYGVDRQQFQKDFDLFSTVDVRSVVLCLLQLLFFKLMLIKFHVYHSVPLMAGFK